MGGTDTAAMSLLIAVVVPLALFGAIDALAVKFGAESRPYFDQKAPLA
jgi:hypothetical protein